MFQPNNNDNNDDNNNNNSNQIGDFRNNRDRSHRNDSNSDGIQENIGGRSVEESNVLLNNRQQHHLSSSTSSSSKIQAILSSMKKKMSSATEKSDNDRPLVESGMGEYTSSVNDSDDESDTGIHSTDEKMRSHTQGVKINPVDDAWNKHFGEYTYKTKLFQKQRKILFDRTETLQRKQNELKKLHDGTLVNDNDVISINAGGETVTVMRSTLTQIKGSNLEALFSGRWENQLIRDNNGNIFLDVNPKCFQCVVDYLEEIEISPFHNIPELPIICTNNKINTTQTENTDRKNNSQSYKDGDKDNDKSEYHYEEDIKRNYHHHNNTSKDNEVFLDYLLRTLIFTEDMLLCPMWDSDIMSDLEPKHMDALSQFLVEEDIQYGGIELLYRASRDGWKSSDFHNHCDHKGPTITLIRSADKEGHVFGGFTDQSWTSSEPCSYVTSPKAFIFGLKCFAKDINEPIKMNQKASQSHKAVCHYSNYGPIFGGGSDIFVKGNANCNLSTYTSIGHTYECPPNQNGQTFLTGSQHFRLNEIEVFAVVPPPSKSDTILKSICKEDWYNMKFTSFPHDVRIAFEIERKEIISLWEQLITEENQFDHEKKFLNFFVLGDTNDIVSFNVKGKQRIACKRSTLGQCPESVLAKQFHDSNWFQRHNSNTKTAATENSQQQKLSSTQQDLRLKLQLLPPSPRIWSNEHVIDFINMIEGISSLQKGFVVEAFSKHEINGIELLAFEREDLINVGVVRPGTVALMYQAINDLRCIDSKSPTLQSITPNACILKDNTDYQNFIRHNEYCFGKIIDQLRLIAMHQVSLFSPISDLLVNANMSPIKEAAGLNQEQGHIFGEREHSIEHHPPSLPPLPYIQKQYFSYFEKLVRYYFPNDHDVALFIKINPETATDDSKTSRDSSLEFRELADQVATFV